MNENAVLICNEQKFVKIYHDDDQNSRTSMQNYYNFLPDARKEEKDRGMPIGNLRNCAKHNRLLMQFNYPESCQPRKVLVIPNISDNKIEMNSRNEKDTYTWMANKKLELPDGLGDDAYDENEEVDDISSVPRIF